MLNNIIPADDIMDIYLEADEPTKRAISSVLASSGNFVCASFAGTAPSGQIMANVDWKVDEDLSIVLLTLTIMYGVRKHGQVWFQNLIQQISNHHL